MHPMSVTLNATPLAATAVTPRHVAANGPIRVAVIGATGYVGGELVRWLAGHPAVTIVGLVGRDRDEEPIGRSRPHLARTDLRVDAALPESDAVFVALPHGQAAALVPGLVAAGRTVIDLGADFRLRDPADYPRWYHFDHPAPALLADAVYGLPELHRAELAAAGDTVGPIVAAPGCYATAAILALAPLARAGLLGDVVVDGKSGVSGAGREPRPDLTFGEVNENVTAYGLDGHRHTAEMEQELAGVAVAAGRDVPAAVTFVPHLVPMTRGILATCHVRPPRPVEQADLDELYRAAYADEPFVAVVDDPPATKHVLASNEARIYVKWQPRSGRIVVLAALDNLAKGAASQAVQAFNVLYGLDERTGLAALPVAP